MSTPVPIFALPLACIASGVANPPAEAWFPTGEPQLLEMQPALTPLLSKEEYRALVASAQSNPAFVAVRDTPTTLSGDARFGFNLVFSGKNRGYVLDGSDERGYVLYPDLNGNGSLLDDEPRRLERTNDGYFVTLPISVEETIEGKMQTRQLAMKLALGEAVPPGQSQAVPVMKKFDTHMRRGIAHVGERAMAFALLGQLGTYDKPHDEVLFDLDGDGLDLGDVRSPERFLVSDGQLRIDGASYAFRVDRLGRGVSLRPLNQAVPTRPSLQVGSDAPDIALVDLDGRTRRLRDYRGKILLLDFWATWCAPCRADAPRLVEIYERFRARGFAVLSVNANDKEADIEEFVGEFGINWPQVREPMDGPAHTLFRVRGWPAYYLIGKDGRIRANHIEWSDLESLLADDLGT